MPTTEQMMRVLETAIVQYTAIFTRTASHHRATGVRLHPQHAIIWPLMGLTGSSLPKVLDSDAHAGMCNGLSNLWIYYQNFFQDGIYAGDRSVHLFDVFNTPAMSSRISRLAVQGADGEASVDRSGNGVSIGLGLQAPARPQGMGIAVAKGASLERRRAAFEEIRAQSMEVNLLAESLEQAHGYGNTSEKGESAADNARRTKAETVRLLARFGCASTDRSKTIGRPWSGVGSHLRAGRFYTLGSGSHAMALSTMKAGVVFYDPNVGELCLPTLGSAPGFFRDYFTDTFEASRAIIRDNQAILGAPQDPSKKKLAIVEWKSTRPGR